MPSPSRRRAIRRAAAIVAALVTTAACVPGGDVDQAQLMLDLNDVMNEMRQENAVLQDQIDGLREDLARQDTLIRRIANLNGLTVP